MPTKSVRSPGRPARLSREQVLAAAFALADEAGIDAVTMSRLGEQVGAQAMSLYRHVEGKEDLLDGLVDLVFAEIELPQPGTDWKETLRRRAISARAALTQHPWAIRLMESRSHPGPATLRHHDTVLATLDAAGFTSETAVHAYNLLDSYVYGFALQEQSLPFNTDEALSTDNALIRQMAEDAYPNLSRVGRELAESGFTYADEFEFGLDLILEGLERLHVGREAVRRPPRATPARAPTRRSGSRTLE